MKKTVERTEEPEMKTEFDFSGGERGKFARRYATGTNLVLLAPDVAEVYKDSDAVNNALRILIQASRRTTTLPGSGGIARLPKREQPRRKSVAGNSTA